MSSPQLPPSPPAPVAMVVRDFFDLDEYEYAARISAYSTARLKKQEIVKTQQQYAACWSIGAGIGAAPFAFGVPLVVSAYGGRRRYVADKKLALIRRELSRRGVDLHKLRKRDVAIPLLAGMAGMGVTVGVDELALQSSYTLFAGAGLPSGAAAAHALAGDSSAAVGGAVHGAVEQVREMALGAAGAAHGMMPGSAEAAQNLAQNTNWVPTRSMSGAVGYHAGMALGQATETLAAGLAARAGVDAALNRM